MNRNPKIYVAGHTGLIGSAIIRKLTALGHDNILVKSHQELDLTDRSAAEKLFAGEKPEYLFLAAAKVGGIYANSTYPAEFIFQNLMIQSNVIDLAFRYKVRKLLFLGSVCMYPRICPQPIKEDFLMTGPIEPTNEPFGVAKLAGIKMCQAYNTQYGTNFISAIPANVYGINDHFDEHGHVVAALIRKFHAAKKEKRKSVTIWGTGKPRREFLYVDDVADACIFLMNKYEANQVINVGKGTDTSILELANIIGEITGFEGEISFDTSKPDGIPRRLLDSSRINALGWEARTQLVDGLKETYAWYKHSIA